MPKIKNPSVAGQFYTGNAEQLSTQLHEFSQHCRKDRAVESRLVIVPHAGYIYSGQLMSEGIGYLAKNLKTIFIIAPSHHYPLEGMVFSSYEKWRTPLGEIPLDHEIIREVTEKFSIPFFDDAFAPEHAAEVEVPFIQFHYAGRIDKNISTDATPNETDTQNGAIEVGTFDEIKIVPILTGRGGMKQVTELISCFYDRPEIGFVISSDLCHFLTDSKAKDLDSLTAQMIESGDISHFHYDQACGSVGICGSVEFAKQRKFSLIRAGMTNSGETSGDFDRVVGYGSWFLYEGSCGEYLKKYYSEYILDLVRLTIATRLKTNKSVRPDQFESLPASLQEEGACFVTLEINGKLRGCIGSIEAHAPLITDLVSNAQNAAFGDPRFRQLTIPEYNQTTISISILTPQVPLEFNSEEELLEKVRPFKDGLIIADNYLRAVYLPSVWEQIPDKLEFLRSLKRKAGMSPNHFSKTFQAWTFTTEYISGPVKPIAEPSGPNTTYIWKGGLGF